MRAVVLDDYDSGPRLAEIPAPAPGAGEILVSVRAASINGFDLFVASGAAKGMMEHRFPVVLGRDFAGVVEVTGSEVSTFKPGDEVFGLITSMELGVGSLAQYVTVPASLGVAHKPAGDVRRGGGARCRRDHSSGSGRRGLTVEGRARSRRRASGGVGGFAVQLAALGDAHVIATALPEDATRLRELGASEIVDYRGDCAETVRSRFPEGVDALIDLVNRGEDFDAMIDLLRAGGRVATALQVADVDTLAARSIAATNVASQADPASLDRIASLVTSKEIVVPIQEVFPLENALSAFEAFRKGKRGKLIVRVGENAQDT